MAYQVRRSALIQRKRKMRGDVEIKSIEGKKISQRDRSADDFEKIIAGDLFSQRRAVRELKEVDARLKIP